MRFALACCALAACYPGVDNSDCAIRCGEDSACPSNLACVNSFCIDDGQRCVDPTLVLAYSFENVEPAMVVDDSEYGNAAGIAGDPRQVPGKHGEGLAFDGIDDGLIVRHAANLAVAPARAFTVSFWSSIAQTDFLRDQILIGKVVMNDVATAPFYEFGVEFDMSDKVIELYLGDDQGNLIIACATTPPPLDTFIHVAFTLDGNEVRGYLDGVEQTCMPNISITDLVIPDHGQNLVIGRQANEQEFFTGTLDDLRIYNRALTPAEITADMNSSVTP